MRTLFSLLLLALFGTLASAQTAETRDSDETAVAQDPTTITLRYNDSNPDSIVVELVAPKDSDSLRKIALSDTLFVVVQNRPDSFVVNYTRTSCAGEQTSESLPYDDDASRYMHVTNTTKQVQAFSIGAYSPGEDNFAVELIDKKSSTCYPFTCLADGYLFLPSGKDSSEIEDKALIWRNHRSESYHKRKTSYIIYDWSTNEIASMPSSVPYDQSIAMHVININPNLYEVEINGQVSNLNTAGLTQLSQLLTPSPATPPSPAEGQEEVPAQDSDEKTDTRADSLLTASQKAACLFMELDIFLQRKLMDTRPSIDFFEAELLILNENIKTILNLDAVSRSTIQAHADQMLEEAKSLEGEAEQQVRQWAAQVRQAAELYHRLINITYEVRSVALQPGEHDLVVFNMEVKKDGAVIHDQPYRVPVRGGIKIDASTGLVFTGLQNFSYATRDTTVSDTTFFRTPDFQTTDSITAITPTTQKIITRADPGIGDLGLGLMAHFYSRNTIFGINLCAPGSRCINNISAGLNLGVVTTADLSPRFMFGVSLIFGLQQRFILSGGLSAGKVKRLAPGLEIGGLLESSTSVVPTNDVTHDSWYISFTFNLDAPTSNTGDD